MAETIERLEKRRIEIVEKIGQLNDLRPGSVTAIRKKCGKANCCCLEPQHPGHGPHWRLTYKVEGTSRTESLSGDAIERAEREIAEFRKFQQLSRDFVEVNTRICQLRRAEGGSGQEKKRPKVFGRKLPRR